MPDLDKARKAESLLSTWRALKAKEAEAKQAREQVEAELVALISTKVEGTDSLKVGNMKVTVTNKLTRKLDYDTYKTIEDSIPEGVRCVDMVPKLNITNLRAMDKLQPGFSAQFITSKPAKAGFKVEEQKTGGNA